MGIQNMQYKTPFTTLILFFLGLGLSASAQAALGFHLSAGAGIWSEQPSGYVNDTGGGLPTTDVNLKSDFGLANHAQGYFWVDFQHPIPVLPDVEIRYSDIKNSGSGVLAQAINYGGNSYAANEKVEGQLNLKQTDFILYYQPLDNVVQLKLGLDVKALDLAARISSSFQSSQAAARITVPMLYAGLGVSLPFTGLSAQVNGSYLGYANDYFADYQAQVAYETPIGLGMQVGYREETLKADIAKNNPSGEIQLKGVFAGLYYDF